MNAVEILNLKGLYLDRSRYVVVERARFLKITLYFLSTACT